MRKISRIYGWPLLVLLLLLLSACGASANEPPAHTMDMAATPASSDAANDHAQETMEANHSETPSASPASVVAPSDEPVATEKPRETEKPVITKAPAETEKPIITKAPTATEKPVKTKPPASTPPPKSTPAPKPSKTPAKTVQPTEAVTVHTVEITNFAFLPEKLEINEGDIVTFINKDEVGHTATADNGDFDTGILAQTDSKKITFSEAGEFSYYCTPHPGMKGIIVVKEK